MGERIEGWYWVRTIGLGVGDWFPARWHMGSWWNGPSVMAASVMLQIWPSRLLPPNIDIPQQPIKRKT